jgi:hypothetical protein
MEDPTTAALYPRDDHRCVFIPGDSLSREWQQRFCVSPGYTNCPYFPANARLLGGAGPSGRSSRVPRWSLYAIGVAMLTLLGMGSALMAVPFGG